MSLIALIDLTLKTMEIAVTLEALQVEVVMVIQNRSLVCIIRKAKFVWFMALTCLWIAYLVQHLT